MLNVHELKVWATLLRLALFHKLDSLRMKHARTVDWTLCGPFAYNQNQLWIRAVSSFECGTISNGDSIFISILWVLVDQGVRTEAARQNGQQVGKGSKTALLL